MGVINKTTEQINNLLEKVEGMPEEGVVGKTPVLETGTTTTLPAGSNATSQVVANGTDESGNPKYKIDFGIPKGQDGASGGSADSVDWSNITNKPTWVNSSTKPTYTATEVGAIPATTIIPSKTSQLTNDSNFTTISSFKTVNGQSIVGSGNIEISGTGGGITDAPSDGKTYGRKNGAWASIENVGGSVDITDIVNRLSELAEVEGTCTDEDYNALKGYADNGVVTYANMDGSSLQFDIKNINNIIILRYNMFGEYADTMRQIIIGTNKIISVSSNSFLSSSNMGDGQLGSYSKPSAYSAITQNDTISAAIGKLEAGIGSGGGSSDDVYYLPEDLFMLKDQATSEDIISAFGGAEKLNEFVTEVGINGKKAYILIKAPGLVSGTGYNIPVSCAFFSFILTSFSICYNVYNEDNHLLQKVLDVAYNSSTNHITAYRLKTIYIDGYTLKSSFYHLNNSSSSEDISNAIGGEEGMKKLIKVIKDGNNIYIGGVLEDNILKTGLIPWMYKELENGNLTISFGTFGYAPWGSNNLYALIIINYTKESNTFNIQVI